MGQKKFNIKANNVVCVCPKCGNNTEFVAHSEQCGIDTCDVWIVCKCGYDPTQGKIGHRMEDVWGTLDKETISVAIDVWNDEILDAYPIN